jgi:two-component system invasion response regulator UvrY
MTNTHSDKIKVIIADDHPIVREGFVNIISKSPDLMVVGEAENGHDLLDKIRALDSDVVITDIDMPVKSGWNAMAEIKATWPKLPVLVLSVFPEEEYAIEFFRAGASGYLNKMTSTGLLCSAIRTLASGQKYISPELTTKLALDLVNDTEKQPHETLSSREFQVLCQIAWGKTVKEISEELSLSGATISTYRARILEKMNLRNNAQLTHYAFKHGLLK